MSSERTNYKDEIIREINKLMGKRLISARIGEDGLDLIFEDGSELELYCAIPLESIAKKLGREEIDEPCTWGLSVSERLLIPTPSPCRARDVINTILSKVGNSVDVDYVVTYDGKTYISVSKQDVEKVRSVLPELFEKSE